MGDPFPIELYHFVVKNQFSKKFDMLVRLSERKRHKGMVISPQMFLRHVLAIKNDQNRSKHAETGVRKIIHWSNLNNG